MNKDGFTAAHGKRPPVPDKVDMSLDDIIRLNRRETQLKRRHAGSVSRRPFRRKGPLSEERGVSQRTGGGAAPPGLMARLRNRRLPPPLGRRRGQGVITGLAARRTSVLLRRAGPFTRAAAGQRSRQKTRPFPQHTETQYRRPEVQHQPYGPADPLRGQNAPSPRRPFQLRRRPPPPVQQTQREARQATFLFHRGLKVQAQVQKPGPRPPPVKTRQWRPPAATTGILTVSIDNPTARTQPEPASAWTLHPPAPSAAPVAMDTAEKKVPKGVPLQFDINSVGKPQTSMTLNERFRILKDRRASTEPVGKGSRFVTVA
ncbi:UAP56-interacting factor-like isoform X2 [Cololabis saira]|uniref:UAP56-interacting factor-like isoform X2 n=1 Tax=Cololabis saira TaxID=129043 RepID=UPI002AD2CDCF|nr:UAP56-interacting factor-like isoform X2 [Cololabis saira]